MHTITKGSIALTKIITQCLKKSYQIYMPFDQSSRVDLIVERNKRLERVQVKYVRSDGMVIRVRCRSIQRSGKINRVVPYTSLEIDWIAVYDETSDLCCFIPSNLLGETGRSMIYLRLATPRSKQEKGILWAKDYLCF